MAELLFDIRIPLLEPIRLIIIACSEIVPHLLENSKGKLVGSDREVFGFEEIHEFVRLGPI